MYGILSHNHPQIQLIAVVHNIALIKKLSKLNYVNIIEMSENYLDKITNFIKGLLLQDYKVFYVGGFGMFDEISAENFLCDTKIIPAIYKEMEL